MRHTTSAFVNPVGLGLRVKQVNFTFIQCNLSFTYYIWKNKQEIQNGLCVDTEPITCRIYAANGLCGDFYKNQLIQMYCPVSCDFCDTNKLAVKCADTQVSCYIWYNLNLCSTLSNLNAVNRFIIPK